MAKNSTTTKKAKVVADLSQEKGGLNTEYRKLMGYKWNKENRSALTTTEAKILGVGLTEFRHYLKHQDALFDATKAYFNAGAVDLSVTDKNLQQKLNKVYDAWRGLIELIQPVADDAERIPFRKFDAQQMLGHIRKKMFIGETALWGTEGKTAFRAKVEDYLGSLVVRNIILDEDETVTVDTYQRAINSINTADQNIDKLNKLLPSLRDALASVKDNEDARKAIAIQVKTAEETLASAIKSKSNAEKKVNEFSAKYQAVLLKLKNDTVEVKVA